MRKSIQDFFAVGCSCGGISGIGGGSWMENMSPASSVHWNAFRTRSHITRCSIERWYNVVPVPPPLPPLKLTFFPGKSEQMSGETVSQTSEMVNSLKRRIAWPSLLFHRFDVLIIPDQFNCWCLFSFKIQSAIVVVVVGV